MEGIAASIAAEFDGQVEIGVLEEFAGPSAAGSRIEGCDERRIAGEVAELVGRGSE